MSENNWIDDDDVEVPLFLGKYEGERNEEGERHGMAKAFLPNGDLFEGHYENGKRHGAGKYVFSAGNGVRYEGHYSKGKRHGQGVMYYPDGSIYDGTWSEGLRSGKGKYKYANGDVYEGNWKNGKRNGLGTYTYQEKGMTFTGNWINGVFEGEGKVSTETYIFQGHFREEQPTGTGRFVFPAVGCQQVRH
ncbi:predicted protein [Nematostella vectensis]|uniref:Radial spoke head 1 homolog n=1 Tax=Nematostella vectensis TaxID=45351 RepID=A7SGU9_NEMVE|nr:predicted protein [Nematostella vectensis]|eukprot:XP_001629106.1 predicted protein [Nematostella vectensis]